MKILLLSPAFPYPLTRGDKLRIYYQLKFLSVRHEITLVSFIDKSELKYSGEVKRYCTTLELVRDDYLASHINMLKNIFTGAPSLLGLYESSKMRAKIKTLLRDKRFDIMHAATIRMAPYLERYKSAPKMIDLIDSYSLNMQRRFHKDHFVKKPLLCWEFAKSRLYEKRVINAFKYVLVVAKQDYAALGCPGNAIVNPNGVDNEYFYYQAGKREEGTLVFIGNLGYYPNVDGVLYFVKRILPLIKKKNPSAKFVIVGADASLTVRRLLKNNSNVIMAGEVEDVRGYLARAALFVSPLRAGSGIQNKILQAMAMGTPVISTSYSASGIECADGEHIAIADNPEAFARNITDLLENAEKRDKISRNARRLVEEKYTWADCVNGLEEVYEKCLG